MGIKTVPDTAMTDEETKLVERVAEIYGISVEEAHTNLGKAGLARRVKKRTGKAPAKVYSIKKR